MSRRKIQDEADARACLNAAATSGLARAAWARANGVDARSLNAWHLNLDRKDAGRLPVDFLELVPIPVPDTGPQRHVLQVRRGELVVDVPEDFDAQHLRRVLSMMATC